jgi:glutamyl/glutaminyl-tRNA synthetase
VEDTDLARSTRASEEAMVADLKWLGLDWDEGGFDITMSLEFRDAKDTKQRIKSKGLGMQRLWDAKEKQGW